MLFVIPCRLVSARVGTSTVPSDLEPCVVGAIARKMLNGRWNREIFSGSCEFIRYLGGLAPEGSAG